jgi:hypothetical protein
LKNYILDQVLSQYSIVIGCEEEKTQTQYLLDDVHDQIIKDVRETYDTTAIAELLKSVPKDALINYLPEEQGNKYKN